MRDNQQQDYDLLRDAAQEAAELAFAIGGVRSSKSRRPMERSSPRRISPSTRFLHIGCARRAPTMAGSPRKARSIRAA